MKTLIELRYDIAALMMTLSIAFAVSANITGTGLGLAVNSYRQARDFSWSNKTKGQDKAEEVTHPQSQAPLQS